MRPVIRAVLFLLAALLASCGADPYGTSAEAPLGDFAKIDELLTGKGLAKQVHELQAKADNDPELEPAAEGGAQGMRYDYTDNARVAEIEPIILA